MRAKVVLTKSFGAKTSTEYPQTPDSCSRVREENKAMAQEIWKISILYPKLSKEFYHHIKFWKSIWTGGVQLKAVLKNFEIFSGISILIKTQALRPSGLSKETHSCFLQNIANFLRTAILKNICEQLLLRDFHFMLVRRSLIEQIT